MAGRSQDPEATAALDEFENDAADEAGVNLK